MKKFTLFFVSMLAIILIGCGGSDGSGGSGPGNVVSGTFSTADQEMFRTWVDDMALEMANTIEFNYTINSEILEATGKHLISDEFINIGDISKISIKRENGFYVGYFYLNNVLQGDQTEKAPTLKELLYGNFTDADATLFSTLYDTLNTDLTNIDSLGSNSWVFSEDEVIFEITFNNNSTVRTTFGKKDNLYTANITIDYVHDKSLASNTVSGIIDLVYDYYSQYDNSLSPNALTNSEVSYLENWYVDTFIPYWSSQGYRSFSKLTGSTFFQATFYKNGVRCQFILAKQDGIFTTGYSVAGELVPETVLQSSNLEDVLIKGNSLNLMSLI